MSVPIDSWVHADSLGLLCETYLRPAVAKQGSADSLLGSCDIAFKTLLSLSLDSFGRVCGSCVYFNCLLGSSDIAFKTLLSLSLDSYVWAAIRMQGSADSIQGSSDKGSCYSV